MRKIRTAVFAGIAALTAAGTAVAATADTRVVNVGLPDGSVERARPDQPCPLRRAARRNDEL